MSPSLFLSTLAFLIALLFLAGPLGPYTYTCVHTLYTFTYGAQLAQL